MSCAFSISVGSEIAHVFGPSRHSHPGTTRRPAPRFRLTPKAGFTQDRPRIVPTPSRPSRDSLVVTQQATEAFAALDWPRKGRIRSGRLLSCAVSLRDSGVAHIRSRSSSPCDSSSQPTLKVGFAPGSRRSIARFGPPSPVRIRSWLAGKTRESAGNSHTMARRVCEIAGTHDRVEVGTVSRERVSGARKPPPRSCTRLARCAELDVREDAKDRRRYLHRACLAGPMLYGERTPVDPTAIQKPILQPVIRQITVVP